MGSGNQKGALAAGAGAGVLGLAAAGLKTAGVAAVKHYGGKWILTKGALYTAGTLGAKGAAVAFLPTAVLGLAALSTALSAAEVIKDARKL